MDFLVIFFFFSKQYFVVGMAWLYNFPLITHQIPVLPPLNFVVFYQCKYNEPKAHQLITSSLITHDIQITINRPERRNAFRPNTVKELIRAFNDARDDSSIGVIILTGRVLHINPLILNLTNICLNKIIMPILDGTNQIGTSIIIEMYYSW